MFIQFDHDALLQGLQEHIEHNPVFHTINGELNRKSLKIDEWDKQLTDIVNSGSGNNTTTEDAVRRTQAISRLSKPVIVDEIPPFDITISMANEYGSAAVMVLYGVEILNQGSQYSMDNIQSQQACTFVARRLKSLEAVKLTD